MKTQSLVLQVPETGAIGRSLWAEIGLGKITHQMVRWAVAITVGLAVILAATWAATTPSAAPYLAAGIWGAGFIFLALATEVSVKRVIPHVVTGMSLPALAVLGNNLAEEFSILAGAVVAGWVASWLVRR